MPCFTENMSALFSGLCGDRISCSGDSDDCLNGNCVCGSKEACSLPESNRCDKGMCMCGKSQTCKQESQTPSCREIDGTKPTAVSTTATCQVSVAYSGIFRNLDYIDTFNIRYF